jgi:hypothetical protein
VKLISTTVFAQNARKKYTRIWIFTIEDNCNGSVHINEPDFARYLHTISPNDGCGDNCYVSGILGFI